MGKSTDTEKKLYSDDAWQTIEDIISAIQVFEKYSAQSENDVIVLIESIKESIDESMYYDLFH